MTDTIVIYNKISKIMILIYNGSSKKVSYNKNNLNLSLNYVFR